MPVLRLSNTLWFSNQSEYQCSLKEEPGKLLLFFGLRPLLTRSVCRIASYQSIAQVKTKNPGLFNALVSNVERLGSYGGLFCRLNRLNCSLKVLPWLQTVTALVSMWFFGSS